MNVRVRPTTLRTSPFGSSSCTPPRLPVMMNVWDVASAKVVTALPGCHAITTASYSIATTNGYPDGKRIPLDEMFTTIARIATDVDLPVSAVLEAGYGDPETAIRWAVGTGAVGCNLEAEIRPFDDAGRAVEVAVGAVQAQVVPFVVNARTDAFMRARDRDRDAVVTDAIAGDRGFLNAGAACVFFLVGSTNRRSPDSSRAWGPQSSPYSRVRDRRRTRPWRSSASHGCRSVRGCNGSR